MKIKTLLALLVLTTLLVSCDDNKVIPGMKKLRVYQQSAVQEDYPFVTSGDAFVFHFYKSEPDDPNIADEEFSEDFFIEIEPINDSFSYSNEDPADYNLPIIYRQYCFCGGYNQVMMNVFDIAGVRESNGDWQLDGEVTLTIQYRNEQTDELEYEWTREVNLAGLFRLSNRPSSHVID